MHRNATVKNLILQELGYAFKKSGITYGFDLISGKKGDKIGQ